MLERHCWVQKNAKTVPKIKSDMGWSLRIGIPKLHIFGPF